jgi:hypothetical protein
MVIDRVGNYMRSWGTVGEEVGQFAPNMPQTITISQRGDVWVVSEGHSVAPTNRLYHFDSFGNFLGMVDLSSMNPNLADIRIDFDWATNYLIVVGRTGGINLLDNNGIPTVTKINTDILDVAQPLDVTVAAGSVLVIPTKNEGFLAFTEFGELLDRFGFPYDETRGDAFQPGEYYQPNGVVVGTDSMVYFAETHPQTGFSQVQAFKFSGETVLPLPRPSLQTATTAETTTALSIGGPISFGGTVRGMLSNQSPQHEYTFQAQAGDRIKITMRDVSSDQSLDTFITLLNGNYTEITFNDDGATPLPEGFKGTDSVLSYIIGTSGTYVIRAGRFGGFGEYELTLTKE